PRTLVDRAQGGRRHQQAGAHIAKAGTRLQRQPVALPRAAEDPARGLGDLAEAADVLARAPRPESLHMAANHALLALSALVWGQRGWRRGVVPGAVLWAGRWAFFSRSLTIASPRGALRLMASDFLLALNMWK